MTARIVSLAWLLLAGRAFGQTAGPAAASPSDWGSIARTWLPVFVAMLSAAIAGFSAWLAWRNQVLGFAKDVAAVRRDTRSKQATLALLAFENSVARPVGQALDLIERLSVELDNQGEIGPGDPATALQRYIRAMFAEHARGQRFCQEADDALPTDRPAPFVRAYIAAQLDNQLVTAALATHGGGAASGPAYDSAADAVVALKVVLRRALEGERASEAARWQDALADDTFLREAERLLPRWLRSRPPTS